MARFSPEQKGYEAHRLKSAEAERVRRELGAISVIFKEYAKKHGERAFSRLAELGAEIARRIVPVMQFKLADVSPAKRFNGGQKRYEEIQGQRLAIRSEIGRLMAHWEAIFSACPQEFAKIKTGFLAEIAAHFLFGVDLGADIYYAKPEDDLRSGTDLIVDLKGLINEPLGKTEFLFLQVKSIPVTKEAYLSTVAPLYIIRKEADRPMLDRFNRPRTDQQGGIIYTNETLDQAMTAAYQAVNLTLDATRYSDHLTKLRLSKKGSLRRMLEFAKQFENVGVGVLFLPSATLDHSPIDPVEGKLVSRPDSISKEAIVGQVTKILGDHFDRHPVAMTS